MKNRIYATPAVKGLNLKHTDAIARESLVSGIFQTRYLIISKTYQRDDVCERDNVSPHIIPVP